MIVINFLLELKLQYLISRERGSEVMFIKDFFAEDYWHFVDVLSTGLAGITLLLYMRFAGYRPLVPFDARPPEFNSPRFDREWAYSFLDAQAWAYSVGLDGLSPGFSFTQHHIYSSQIGGNSSRPMDGFSTASWTNEDAFALLSELSTLGELWDWIMFFASLNSLLLTLRVLKYLPSLPQLKVLITTIQKCIVQIMVFAVIIVILLTGF